jgi:hypothetical protein
VKNLNDLNQYRDMEWEFRATGTIGNADGGCFKVVHDGAELRIMASRGGGWDHISISLADRCPTWEEMEHIRKLFSLPNETWLQFGVPSKEHVNCHPYCLHWWRPLNREVKLPPSEFVGPKSAALA